METSISAIVLSKIRYKDNDVIVKLFTKEYGVISFIVKIGSNLKKSKAKLVYFQELTILNVQFNYNTKRDLQYIKDINIKHHYISCHSDLEKASIIIFLSEILSNILVHQKKEVALYNYIEESFIWYDSNKNISYFHLIFLIQLTRFLGFYPDETNNNFKYFNLEEGIYELSKSNEYSISGEDLKLFNQILGTKFDSNPLLTLNSLETMNVLDIILTYYRLHINNFKNIKSIEIIKNIFN